MPCNMMDGVDWASVNADEAKKKADNVTDLLCGLMRSLEKRGLVITEQEDPALFKWWQEHKIHDKKHGR